MMKKLCFLLFGLIICACNTISKEEYLANSCDCLQGVESTSENLRQDIADCLRSHFTAYNKGAKYSVQEYLNENPSATEEAAQNHVVENLHQELLEVCPKYGALNKVISTVPKAEQ